MDWRLRFALQFMEDLANLGNAAGFDYLLRQSWSLVTRLVSDRVGSTSERMCNETAQARGPSP